MTDPNQHTPDPSVPPAAPAAPAEALSHEQDVQWASFAHLGGILGILPSLIIWLVFKDRGRFTDTEAKEALNFQITALMGWVALFILSSILTAVTFGLFGYLASLLYFALWAAVIVFSILGFLKANG